MHKARECEIVLKYSFKLFFLTRIFEFMINTASQGQNGVNGREKYVKAITFKLPTVQWSHGPVVWEPPVLRWRKLGRMFKSRRGYSQVFNFRCFFLSSYFYLASPQTSFGVHSSRIHFSPTEGNLTQSYWTAHVLSRWAVVPVFWLKFSSILQKTCLTCRFKVYFNTSQTP